MNTEAFNTLNAVRVIDLRIQRLLSKKEMLESCLLPSGIRYDLDKVQGSYQNQMEKLTGEISAVEQELREMFSAKRAKAAEIELLIDQVSSDECKTILYMRFLSNKRIKDIAGSMSYSNDWVYKKMRKGVDEVGRIIHSN